MERTASQAAGQQQGEGRRRKTPATTGESGKDAEQKDSNKQRVKGKAEVQPSAKRR